VFWSEPAAGNEIELVARLSTVILKPAPESPLDALLLAETTLKLDPKNDAVKNLVQQLKAWITESSFKPKK